MIEFVDGTLFFNKVEELQVRHIISKALLCPSGRPTMAAIVATLERSLNLEAEDMEHSTSKKEIHAQLFSSETSAASASMITLASMENYNSGSALVQRNLQVAHQI